MVSQPPGERLLALSSHFTALGHCIQNYFKYQQNIIFKILSVSTSRQLWDPGQIFPISLVWTEPLTDDDCKGILDASSAQLHAKNKGNPDKSMRKKQSPSN